MVYFIFRDRPPFTSCNCTWSNSLHQKQCPSAFQFFDCTRKNGQLWNRHWDNIQRLKQSLAPITWYKFICPLADGVVMDPPWTRKGFWLTIVLLSLPKWLNPLLRRQQHDQTLRMILFGSAVEAYLEQPLGLQDSRWKRKSIDAMPHWEARSSHSPRDVRSSGSIGKWWK